ncbi:MAPEG family protein [Sphingobium sp. BS19]|uniref:MAPEG family protein n=1 Tax=Sphingobium sp. BS19 TaxID=3018973 RepID=UPI0022EF7E9D|nr:MAPEG family protein [Sphingobium sp. BS19]GLI98598.1 glutathione S-transferase [Sphingobium sp. BS19]
MFLPITLTFAAAAALINLWLAMRIGRIRMAEKVLHGDGGNSPLSKRMRAQSNYVEYTPFVLILTGLVEMALGSATWLWATVAAYLVARILHAFGMDSDTPAKTRMIGILVTFVVIIALSIAALYAVYIGMGEGMATEPLSATA